MYCQALDESTQVLRMNNQAEILSIMSSTRVKDLMEIERVSLHARRQHCADMSLDKTKQLSEEALSNAFRIFDVSDCGFVIARDVPMLMDAVGLDSTLLNLPSHFEDQEAKISFEELQQLTEESRALHSASSDSKKAFSTIARDGIIDLGSMKAALAECGARVTDEDVLEVLKYCDLNGDGVLDESDWNGVVEFMREVEAAEKCE